ncbi:MAG: hypothetical protein A2176_02360 [Spirochaetes bacterium RBG_13_51_14]|nr:MAG: hypothetical protein A2176_02360 [Spirochaetes bacterium RBG_13_51_14]
MDFKQAALFHPGDPHRPPGTSYFKSGPHTSAGTVNEKAETRMTETDHHMIDIISAYIQKLPDKDTKKYIAAS